MLEAKPYVDDPSLDADIAPAQRRTLCELGDHTCRWPVGDPAGDGFFFCGGERLPDQPYCAAHRARAWRRRTPATAMAAVSTVPVMGA